MVDRIPKSRAKCKLDVNIRTVSDHSRSSQPWFNQSMESEIQTKKKGIHGLTLTPLKHPIMRTPVMQAFAPQQKPTESKSYRQRFLEWAESQEPGYREYLLTLTESQQVRKLA